MLVRFPAYFDDAVTTLQVKCSSRHAYAIINGELTESCRSLFE